MTKYIYYTLVLLLALFITNCSSSKIPEDGTALRLNYIYQQSALLENREGEVLYNHTWSSVIISADQFWKEFETYVQLQGHRKGLIQLHEIVSNHGVSFILAEPDGSRQISDTELKKLITEGEPTNFFTWKFNRPIDWEKLTKWREQNRNPRQVTL